METAARTPEQTGEARQPFEHLLEIDAEALTPAEAVQVLSSLEQPDDQQLYQRSFRLNDVLNAVSLTDDWRLIDRSMSELKRLGAVDVSDDKLDPDFEGNLITPKVLRDPEHPDSVLVDSRGFAARTIELMRQKRRELFDQELDNWVAKGSEQLGIPKPEHLSPEMRAEVARRMIAASKPPEVSPKAPDSTQWEQALSMDREARAQSEVYEHYNRMIADTPDVMLKKQLESQRDKQMEAARGRLQKVNLEAAKLVGEVKQAVDERHEIARRFDRKTTPNLEEQALANREAYGLKADAPHDWHDKLGGWRFSKARRSPRIIEEGWVSPNSPHIVLVERRLRSNGELLSQEIRTIRKAAKEVGGKRLPPRSFFNVMKHDRDLDLAGNQGSFSDYVAGWGDHLPGSAGKSFDRKLGKQRRSRSWILSWFGL